MHSDEELAESLGAKILERETIHQWPLSCVQKLLLDGGGKLIYKSQLPPTVEAQFYRLAGSSILPKHRVLDRLGKCDTMVIEWIEASLLSDMVLSEDGLLDHGKRVVGEIAEIQGELPAYLDIGTASAWSDVAAATLRKLEVLIRNKRFKSLSEKHLRGVETWTELESVIQGMTERTGIIHGDLKADQIFIVGNEYRVIDWQRPVRGPVALDLVSLLEGQRIDSRKYIDLNLVKGFWFLRLHWAVEAQVELFPDFRGRLFDQWASEGAKKIVGDQF